MLIGWNESNDGLKNYAPIGGTLLGQQLAAANGSSLVGFQQAGTGAVVRTAQDKMREWVSVKDFGAVGDGVADDTAAIQAATSASKSVFFPPGTYKISGSSVGWDSVNDVCMFGVGWESKIVRVDVGSVVKIQNATRVVVRDLYVQGVKTYNAAAGGIGLLNCVNFSVTGNYVTASSRQGINIEACSEGLVSNNHVTNSWQDGIMVRNGSRRVTVTGNVVWENGEPTFAPPVGEGIHIYESQEIAVVGNTVKGNKDNGITLEGADYTTVTGNVIYGQVVSGVSVNAATGYSGIGAVIACNVIKDNGAFGVIMTRVSDGILSDNVIAENGSEGISIGISSNPADVQERWSVSGNRITNNTNYGVLVNWYSSKNRISGNIIDQPVGNALTVVRAECGSNIVQDNTITAGAITDSGTETRIYDNDLGQKLSGRVTLVAGASTITFSTNMPNSQYVVALEGSANETFFTFNKLVSGFEIRSSNAASTAQVRWRIVDQRAI